MTAVTISLVIFITYLLVISVKYGVPDSISDSFYLLEGTKKKLGIIFTLFCWVIVGFLLPTWLDNSPENYQFLAFLACGALCFVGTAAQFKEDFVKKVHFISAGISAISAIIWMCLMGYWFIPVGVGITTLSIIWLGGDKFVKRTYLFWLEVVGFISLYLALELHILFTN